MKSPLLRSVSVYKVGQKCTFLPRDARSASAVRGIASVGRPSVCLSVRPSLCDVDLPWAYVLGN